MLIRAMLVGVLIVVAGRSPAAAAPFTICGTLQALTPHVAPLTPGSATIDGRTFRLTSALSTNDTNRIEPAVRVGDRVCLIGDRTLAPSPGGNVELMQNFVLASCAGANAPAACLMQLPSTSSVDHSVAPFDPEVNRSSGRPGGGERPVQSGSLPIDLGAAVVVMLLATAVLTARRHHFAR